MQHFKKPFLFLEFQSSGQKARGFLGFSCSNSKNPLFSAKFNHQVKKHMLFLSWTFVQHFKKNLCFLRISIRSKNPLFCCDRPLQYFKKPFVSWEFLSCSKSRNPTFAEWQPALHSCFIVYWTRHGCDATPEPQHGYPEIIPGKYFSAYNLPI